MIDRPHTWNRTNRSVLVIHHPCKRLPPFIPPCENGVASICSSLSLCAATCNASLRYSQMNWDFNLSLAPSTQLSITSPHRTPAWTRHVGLSLMRRVGHTCEEEEVWLYGAGSKCRTWSITWEHTEDWGAADHEEWAQWLPPSAQYQRGRERG